MMGNTARPDVGSSRRHPPEPQVGQRPAPPHGGLTFASERLSDVHEEAWPLLLRHWEELALNKDAVRLDPDWEGYARLEASDMLHVATARDAHGGIVGYASYVMVPNLHYRSMMVADGDIFYLAPEHRRGRAGIDLLKAAESQIVVRCKAMRPGYDCVYLINKEKTSFLKDGRPVVGPVLQRLGFSLIEHYYAKRVDIV